MITWLAGPARALRRFWCLMFGHVEHERTFWLDYAHDEGNRLRARSMFCRHCDEQTGFTWFWVGQRWWRNPPPPPSPKRALGPERVA